MSLLEVKDLKTYFYTDAGVGKAVDGVTFSLEKGKEITIPAALSEAVIVAGAKLDGDKLLTNGGRVTGTTAIAGSLEEAIREAYRLADGVVFEKAYRRSDIGQRALQANQ